MQHIAGGIAWFLKQPKFFSLGVKDNYYITRVCFYPARFFCTLITHPNSYAFTFCWSDSTEYIC